MIINEIWTHRNLIKKMAIIDMKRKYKASALSGFWLVFAPALMIFTYWFSFAAGGMFGDTVIMNNIKFPRISWLIIGVMTWTYCGDIIASGPSALKGYSWIVTKFGVPLTIPPIFVNISKFIVGSATIFVSWIINIIIVVSSPSLEGVRAVTPYILELPIVLFLLFCFLTVWSLLFAPLNAISRDFQNLIVMIPMFVSWVSSVFIPLETADSSNPLYIISQINPFYFLITGVRKTILGSGELFTPDNSIQWYSILSFFLFFILFAAIALFINKKARRIVVDLI